MIEMLCQTSRSAITRQGRLHNSRAVVSRPSIETANFFRRNKVVINRTLNGIYRGIKPRMACAHCRSREETVPLVQVTARSCRVTTTMSSHKVWRPGKLLALVPIIPWLAPLRDDLQPDRPTSNNARSHFASLVDDKQPLLINTVDRVVRHHHHN